MPRLFSADPLPIRHQGDPVLSAILVRLERLAALVEGKHQPEQPGTYLTAKEAATYLAISYSTFRKRATRITRMPGTGTYRREDLDTYAASQRPKRKR
jgi:hypothetical protein